MLVVAFSSCSKENYSRTSVWLCLCVPALLLQAFIDIFGLEEDKAFILSICVLCVRGARRLVCGSGEKASYLVAVYCLLPRLNEGEIGS